MDRRMESVELADLRAGCNAMYVDRYTNVAKYRRKLFIFSPLDNA
jgi:hypothetical protein